MNANKKLCRGFTVQQILDMLTKIVRFHKKDYVRKVSYNVKSQNFKFMHVFILILYATTFCFKMLTNE